MKRLIFFAVVLLLGFYVAWPAWTGYQIREAIKSEDVATLERKVDFNSVRASLKPVVDAELTRALERLKQDAGPLGAVIGGQLRDESRNRLIDQAVTSLITPPNVIRIAKQGANFRQAFERVMMEQVGKGGGALGGLGGLGRLGDAARRGQPAAGEAPRAEAPDQKGDRKPGTAGLGSIKSFALDGPLGFSIGVAKDPAATEPEITAKMAFTGGDWKVVGLIPRLKRE